MRTERTIFSRDYYELGTHLLNLDSLDEAIIFFEQSLKYGSKNTEAHHNLGIAFLRLGMTAKARTNFERAITLKTD